MKPMHLLQVAACVLFATLGVSGCASPQQPTREVVRVASPTRQPDEAAAFTREATRRIDEGEPARARRLLERALEADASFGPAHNNLGLLLLGTGRLYEAALAFERASALMPRQTEPRFNLGLVLERAGRLDEAVEKYERALAQAPDNPRVLGALVRARLRRGDRDATLRQQLDRLILRETRPNWREWALRQRATLGEAEGLRLDQQVEHRDDASEYRAE